ncbi:CinA family nicotinamide mononucleotide deamidase-related protein [Desulfospira joergensenii]|uniref:CinA family nicotinamide mononucleotide deamidase-related protein n=1 Tax=Desulfospira joergensenii TaxID=53329 RepID=UPI0003B67E23|nr:CinA family nicotinamide mononucleotide deamidase-related protein [Desulfospira joergensenii]
MIAQILSTGDEILLGDLVDTNANFLCDRLKQANIHVKKLSAVGDDLDLIVETLKQISRDTDLCLVTGGLGPTQDDLSSEACARAAGEERVFNEEAGSSMEVYFKKRGFELTQENQKQALLPASAGVLVNHHGTAPGFYMRINQCLFFFMPGVPSEMKLMFENVVLPRIQKEFDLDIHLVIERLTLFGLGESMVGARLKAFSDLFPGIRLGFRASFPCVEVKLVMSDTGTRTRPESLEKMARAKAWAVEQLEGKVFSLTGSSIQAEVGRILRDNKLTLAVAESCTGGLISNWITDVAGSSDYFLFSGITYSNEAKVRILQVSLKTLEEHGAVHEETALEMARGARKAAGSDWAVSTTGIAGPGGGSDEKPVGTVCIGVAGPKISLAKRFHFTFDNRDRNKKIFAATALNFLRRQLLKG